MKYRLNWHNAILFSGLFATGFYMIWIIRFFIKNPFTPQALLELTAPIFMGWAIFILLISIFKVNKQSIDLERLLHSISSDKSFKKDNIKDLMQGIVREESEMLAAHHKTFFDTVDTLNVRTEEMTKMMGTTTTQLLDVSATVSENLRETSFRLQEQLQDLISVSDTLKNSSFDQDTREIVETANTTVKDISSATESLQQVMLETTDKTTSLISDLNVLVKEQDAAHDQFASTTEKMLTQSNAVIEESQKLDRLIAEESETLEEKASKTKDYAYQFKEILEDQTRALSSVSDTVGMQIRLAETSLEKQTKILFTSVEQFMGQVGQIENQVGKASQALLKISNTMNNELETLYARSSE